MKGVEGGLWVNILGGGGGNYARLFSLLLSFYLYPLSIHFSSPPTTTSTKKECKFVVTIYAFHIFKDKKYI